VRMPLFRGTKRWAVIISATLLSSLLLAACDDRTPSILNTFGPVAQSEANLFWFILVVATIVFVVVEGVLIYSIIRFRERPGMPNPRQIHGGYKIFGRWDIEIVWTIAPSLFLFAVLGATILTMFNLGNLGSGPTMEVRVVGHQWWWEFDYLKFNGQSYEPQFVTADSLHIPAGTIVQADLASDNVIHSFWIPALTGKTDVIPGHDNKMLFKADMNAVGRTFRGTCAEFCGAQHAHMSFNVIVDTQGTFNTWVSAQQQAATPVNTSSVACTTPIPQSNLVACGAKFFAQGACVGCHGIVGVNLTSYNDPKAAGLIGPNLTHFGSRNLIAGGVLDNDPGGKNLAIWLQNPQDVKPGSDMPDLGLSQDQINALVAYLESLK